MYRALTADVPQSVVLTYPRLLPLHPLADAPDAAPAPLRASVDRMNDHGVYLLENGVHMLLWVGSAAPAQFTADVFGVSSPQQLDPQVCELPDRHNATSQAVRAILHDAREKRRSCMRVSIYWNIHTYYISLKIHLLLPFLLSNPNLNLRSDPKKQPIQMSFVSMSNNLHLNFIFVR
ncbi:hypothetical protein O3G_MSEX000736 [Manduca sexta]|nr:hypothetical protein O3G_MSEX000736 [Manduca sexta]